MARLMKKPNKQTSGNAPAAAKVISRTEVRNTPVPKVSAPAKVAAPATPAGRIVTHDQIARRAYEIWSSGTGGSDFDNWVRAERELRGR